MGLAALNTDTEYTEKRMNQRVKLNVLGRYMLPNETEFDCKVTEMSPGDLAVNAPVSGELGERVILYVDHIGRVDGQVSRCFDGGFAVQFNPSSRKRDKLAAKLTWLANRHELSLPEDRRHDRIIPQNPIVKVTLADGRTYNARITDMSLSGAALDMEVKPAIGTRITIGQMRAQVVRHFDEGIALEFASLQERDTLEAFLRA